MNSSRQESLRRKKDLEKRLAAFESRMKCRSEPEAEPLIIDDKRRIGFNAIIDKEASKNNGGGCS